MPSKTHGARVETPFDEYLMRLLGSTEFIAVAAFGGATAVGGLVGYVLRKFELSYEVDGRERLLEVKTTKYGSETPFFVTDNEVRTSDRYAEQYHVYRFYSFRRSPAMYALSGALERSCLLSAKTFLGRPK